MSKVPVLNRHGWVERHIENVGLVLVLEHVNPIDVSQVFSNEELPLNVNVRRRMFDLVELAGYGYIYVERERV